MTIRSPINKILVACKIVTDRNQQTTDRNQLTTRNLEFLDQEGVFNTVEEA